MKQPWTTCSPESLTWATASLTLQRRKPIPLRNDENQVCAMSAQPPRVPVGRSAAGTHSHSPNERAHGHESIAVRAPRCVSLAQFGSHEVAEDVMLVKFGVKHNSVDFPVYPCLYLRGASNCLYEGRE